MRSARFSEVRTARLLYSSLGAGMAGRLTPAVAVPSFREVLDTLMSGRPLPSGGNIRGVGSSPLRKMQDALLRAVRVSCLMPLYVAALSHHFKHDTYLMQVCLFSIVSFACLRPTPLEYLIIGFRAWCIMSVVASGMQRGPGTSFVRKSALYPKICTRAHTDTS